MRRVKRMVGWAFLVVVVALAIFLVPTVWLKPWSIDHFYARVFLRFALRHPMLLSDLGMLDHTALDFHSDDLDDLSVAALRREARFVDDELKMLRSYDRKKMTESADTSYDVLEWFLADQQLGNRFLLHDYPVNQLFGAQSATARVHDEHASRSAGRRRRELRGAAVEVRRGFDQVIERTRMRASQLGVVPPRFVLQKVLAEMQRFVAQPPREHPLYAHFETEAATARRSRRARRNDASRARRSASFATPSIPPIAG